MIVPGSVNPLLWPSGKRTFKSLRFSSPRSTYLSRTPSVSGNQTKWTLSLWVKPSRFGSQQPLLSVFSGFNDYFLIGFSAASFINSYDNLKINAALGAGNYINLHTNSSTCLFRDPNAWYHIVINVDTSQAVESERVKLYVNGSRVTNFSNAVYPPQNANIPYFNQSGYAHQIGSLVTGSYGIFDGYMTEVCFVDGQALLPSSFASNDLTTGQWTPLTYSGSYGTNGFYLDFLSGTNLTTLCSDKSGNGNNWASTNHSLAAGITYDWMDDNPLNNYCSINPLNTSSGITLSGGGLDLYNPSVAWYLGYASMPLPTSGAIYFELTVNSAASSQGWQVGFSSTNQGSGITAVGPFIGCDSSLSYIYINGSMVGSYGSDFPNGTVIQFAIDITNNKSWIGKAGVWYDSTGMTGSSGNPATGANPVSTTPLAGAYIFAYLDNNTINFNFGQRPFANPVPAGFRALCTDNLPVPAVIRSDSAFDIYSYRGNGGGLQVGEFQKPQELITISQSLRFDSARSSYLSRTFGASGNTQKWSYAAWAKLTSRTDARLLTTAYLDSYCYGLLTVTPSGTVLFFDVRNASPGSNTGPVSEYVYLESNEKLFLGDWNHIVCIVDTTQATATNRVKIYVNGTQLSFGNTDWGGGAYSTTYPSLNKNLWLNSNHNHYIGAKGDATAVTNGYMAEITLLDGVVTTVTDFGQWDGNGYWVPKTYSGSYGTNGFRLTFSNNSSVANLGLDSSGNGRTWAVSGTSLTAGVTYDWVTDTPSNNYCTLTQTPNSLSGYAVGATVYDGSLTATGNSSANTSLGSMPLAGKIYYEMVATNAGNNTYSIGIADISAQTTCFYENSGAIWVSGVYVNSVAAFGIGDVVALAVDTINCTMGVYKNGSLLGTYSIRLSPNSVPAFYTSLNTTVVVNFGQRPFSYTPPTGFKTLCENNMTEYTVDVETPDLVWIMRRDSGANANLFNSISGPGKYLSTNSYAVETTDVNSLVGFNKNGIYLGGSSAVNALNGSYVAWAWKAGSSTVSNTSGSITSQVRANPTAGVSIVQFTGTLAAATIGHGLSSAPQMIITKPLQATTTVDHWQVYHSALGPTKFLTMSNADAAVTYPTRWNDTYPTASVFTVGSAFDTKPHLAICFSEVPGFSKMGSYVGNGSADGPFFYCGFRPRWVLLKSSTSATYWMVFDTTRDGSNIMSGQIYPNTATAESAVATLDIVSNGFKLRYTGGYGNDPGQTYVVLAFAEAPYKYALAR